MKTLKNIFKVVLGNFSTILSGVFVGFLLPKVISVSDYGFYKIFTLYLNYLGVLSLGIIDGIVLKYGDKNFDELNREKFRGYFSWYLALHCTFSLLILMLSLFMTDVDYKFVILMLSANLLPVNVVGYFQQVSQITQRFKEYSLRKIIQSVANVVILLLLFAIYKCEWGIVTYKLYLCALLLLNVCLMAWYIYTYRDIIFGKRARMKEVFSETVALSRIGFPLLLANLCSTLILSLDRQFVSMLFTTEEYATYAFAYSMLSLITVATSAISIVIYPIFKRAALETLQKHYHDLNAVILVLVFTIVLVYYPLCWFIGWFLPQYTESLEIFKIILPGLVISTSITVMMHNYYKVIGKSDLFFKKSVIALAISFIANIIAYTFWGTRASISIASVISMLLWYFITEHTLVKTCGFSCKNTLYLILGGAAFYLCAALPIWWMGCGLNIVVICLITALVYWKDFKKIKPFLLKTNSTTV